MKVYRRARIELDSKSKQGMRGLLKLVIGFAYRLEALLDRFGGGDEESS